MFYLIYEFFYDPKTPMRFLRLFKYAPFRSMCAALTGFFLVFFVMPWFIRLMRRKGLREQARHYSELDSGYKSMVPTMGGLPMLGAMIVSALLWCDPRSTFVLVALAACIGGAALGLGDDLAKVRRAHSDHGLSRGAKYAGQILVGLFLGIVLVSEWFSPVASETIRRSLYIPGVKSGLYLGWFTAAAVVLFIVIAMNGVNLTDGMDGLAAVPAILVFLVLAVFSFVIGRADLSNILLFFNLPGAEELTVLCCAGAGACAGFLWFNAFPATIMMGDTGSLGLGALLAAIAVLIRQEGIFIIAGGLFVFEVASSFIQDNIGLKLLGRRIFFRAPFHSSVLHRGVSESKVTIRFWLISGTLAVAALAMLKIR